VYLMAQISEACALVGEDARPVASLVLDIRFTNQSFCNYGVH
jgi:hypothetical protein